MAKIRVHELSKQLNIPAKDILAYLGEGFTTQSGLDESQVALVKEKVQAAEKSKSLVKRVLVVKANRNPEAPKAETPVAEKKEAAPEVAKKAAPKAAEPADQPVKKKPKFVFRPENSKTGLASKLPKTAKPETPVKPETKKPAAGPIRANVPTTAEQYRDFVKETEEKTVEAKAEAAKAEETPKTETVVPEITEVKPEVQAVETPEAKAEDTKPEVAKTVEAAAKAPEKTEAPEQVETVEKPEETKQPETVEKPETVETAPKAVEKPAAKAPEKPAKSKKTETAKKPAKPVAAAEVEAPKAEDAKKPAINILGWVDPKEVKNAESKRGLFAGKAGGKVHIVDNRNRNGQQGGKTAGQKPLVGKDGKPIPGNRQGLTRPGKPGAAAAAKAGDKLVTKPDTRNQKGGKNAKKNDYDRKDKKAENFKNLTKDLGKKPKAAVQEEVIRMITIPEVITIKDLSDRMRMKPAELIKKLFLQGKMMTLNSELTYEEAEALALEYDILSEKEVEVNVIEELLKEGEEDEKLLEKRPPVVCVMGHVDHGKTSLLDAIRRTNVTSREAGGITQHIGAYMVECKGEKITFLDTPGHEAFTAMRMRGAQATDIAILVVAADDGVMPQTVEAINHAKSANVEIIVAVNKIDKPGANVDRVKQELMEYGLVAEEWGGNTIFVPISAKTGENIDQLLEMVLLVTEVKELKANPNREVRGIVIEAKLDKGRGPVATVLVQKGTLKQGDFVSAGSTFGRVRAMLDADGNTMKTATPSTPVEILGLNGVPNAGEICLGHKNERDARSYADTFIAEEKKKKLAESKHKLTRDSLFEQIKAGELKELPLVVKADVQGSVEAIRTSLEKLSNDEVTVRVIHSGVGAISESDVTLASASNAIVIGFNIKPDAQAKALAESEEVDMRLYTVIYQAIDDIDAAMKGMKAPVYEEKVLAHAEVRMIFKASGVGVIAGSYVLDGTIERGSKARITRGKEQIFEGNIASLKRFKDDVKEVREGFECGIVFEKFNDIMEGDLIEVYKMVQVKED